MPATVNPSDPALVAKGKELFDSVGCRACHAIGPDEVATPVGAAKDWAPNLSRVGEKEGARFIYWWIKDPRSYNPNANPDITNPRVLGIERRTAMRFSIGRTF